MPSLFSAQPLVLETAYSELKRLALEQRVLLSGTPGSVSTREVSGRSFLYRQFYDAQGKKAAEYLGPADDAKAIELADETRETIDATNGLLEQGRMLARQGYVRVDARSGAIVSALANGGLFRAGAIVVGSHAYGALLNELGVKSAAFVTEDVDIARAARLELDAGAGSFEELLARSTVRLSPVLGFDRKAAPTSYKAPGRDRLRVDLLVPARGADVSVRSVPELKAHATALPYLAYLLEAPIDAVLIGRESIVPIKVPRPERFVWHKMLVSQVRAATSEKRSKDLLQAAVLFARLAERDPASLEEAFAARVGKTKVLAGAAQVLRLLEASPHERATEMLRAML